MDAESIKSLGLFTTVLEKIADNVMITDRNGIIEYVNPAFETTTGYSKQEALGQTPRILRSGLNSSDYYQKLWETIMSGRPFRATTPNKKKNGSIYYADQTITPIRNSSGEILHFVSIWKDISDRVFLEKEMKILNEKLIEEQHRFEHVLAIEAVLHTLKDQNHLIDFVVERTCTVLESQKCSLMFIDEESSELCMKGYKGLDEDKIEGVSLKLGDQIEDLIELHHSANEYDLQEPHQGSLRIDGTVYQSDHFLSVPIQVGDHLLGIFNVFNKRAEHTKVFTDLDLKILMMIIRQVNVAIENAKLYKHLNDLTLTDAITGIHNYRYFIQTFDYEILRARRYKRDLSLMMIDIDYFKAYNDKFGHPEGDKLLKALGKVMKDNLRESDGVCRYAGDEFAVILPETDIEKAKITAEKIRKKVEELTLEQPVTISIGVTQCDPSCNRHDHVYRADRALYSAKEQGRNRVYVCIRKNGSQL